MLGNHSSATFRARASCAVLVAVAVLSLGVGATVAQDDVQPWIHVEITGDGADTQNMNLNLPLSAAEALLALVPDTVMTDGQLKLAEQGVPVSVSAMRGLWQELVTVGDTEFITIEQDDETVRVARTGDNIEIRVEDRNGDGDETVDVQIPVAVVDALLSGDSDKLNIRAAIQQLSVLRGDIVRVTENDRQIRVWIDEVAQP